MNKNRIDAVFAPEARFDVRPHPPAPFRATLENEFERLKLRLLGERLRETDNALNAPVRRAANEAAAVAWATLFPLLVFPELFEEKIDHAVRQAERQARIFAQSRELVVTA